MTCACPRIDARACMRVRYNLDLRELLSVEDPPPYDPDLDESCECYCHDTTGDLYDGQGDDDAP